jgi:hypothetical protein
MILRIAHQAHLMMGVGRILHYKTQKMQPDQTLTIVTKFVLLGILTKALTTVVKITTCTKQSTAQLSVVETETDHKEIINAKY